MVENSFRRNLLGALMIVGVVTLLLAVILGDRFTSWVKAIRGSARQELEDVVNQPRYRLVRAEEAVETARQRCNKLSEAVAQNETLLKTQERALEAVRRETEECQTALTAIEDRRKSGQPVRLRGGRELTDDEVALRLHDLQERLEQSREKTKFLEAFVQRCRQRKEKLQEYARQAPLELAKLDMSLNHLRDKTLFHEEQRKLLAAEGDAAPGDGIYQEARKTLDRAHGELDAGLKRFDSTLPNKSDLEID